MTGACQTINTRADGHLEITPAASTRGTQQPQLHPLVRPTSTTCPATSTAFPLELVPTSTPYPTSTTASPASPLHHLHHQQHLPHPGQHRPTHCTQVWPRVGGTRGRARARGWVLFRAPTGRCADTEQQLRCPLCTKELLDMGCFDCGAVEWECEDYPELCSYTTGYCVCGDYTLSAQPTTAL